jgi:uroporphyrin-III C-methyltransferase / precorrin-2 dehydrogenase / sirohydrochlorin ferrochelatase
MHSLPLFVRLNKRPVILLGKGEAADAKRRLLERAGARIVGEKANAVLAIVAIDDEKTAQAAIARLKARHILVNAVDRPADCDFTLPAIVDRDPVLIAIGTGGASAGLAKALRQRLELLFPQSLGTLAEALSKARSAIRRRWPDAGDRRRSIDAALDPGGMLDPFRSDAASRVEQWIDLDHVTPRATSLTFLITSDTADDLTLATARAMGQADRIIHSKAVSSAILDRARADAIRIEGDILPNPLPDGLTVLLLRD